MFYFKIILLLLIVFAVFDLVVGVSNDAVNFLNSSFGSGVAKRKTILIVASFGIMAGVIFSSGMMEVARKGIFHPAYFNLQHLLTLFIAVMFTDIILLDLFNTIGLPTSTTVSVVFELLGAATAISIIKVLENNEHFSKIAEYLNTARAMLIIFGILLSVAVSFITGAIIQILTRLIFTFDYKKRIKKYGALWGGAGIASIFYFILIKGAKGAVFFTPEMVHWIKTHTISILLSTYIISIIIFQIMISKDLNILKPIILIGTFALAMAFSANDLVNFIGVPIAGYHAFITAIKTPDPLHSNLVALQGKMPANSWFLIFAGIVMVLTLWLSKKAKTVTETEIGLAAQEEGYEDFESNQLARGIVRLWLVIFNFLAFLIPSKLKTNLSQRLNSNEYIESTEGDTMVTFDLLRAAVNLVVASALISYATSKKLPLSTTYVTFMVAMGTSFADKSWGRDTAVYRVTGVLTVIGGWFMTALLAFTISLFFAFFLFYTKIFGVIVLIFLTVLSLRKTRQLHSKKEKTKKELVFNLKKVTDPDQTIITTFRQMGILLKEMRLSIELSLDGLFNEDIRLLTHKKKKIKTIQKWTNIIIANVFKAIRLLQKSGAPVSDKYPRTVHRLQELADAQRDMIMRSYTHILNQHKGLLAEQKEDLSIIMNFMQEILIEIEEVFNNSDFKRIDTIKEKYNSLLKKAEELNKKQFDRIIDHTSKTRLTILFYFIIEDAITLSHQSIKLVDLFRETFTGKINQE